MHKRLFLGAALAAASLPTLAQAPAPARPRKDAGPALVTVTGERVQPNRGPFDPVRDQLFAKQKLNFTRARAFDHRALMALPAASIKPTLEYDRKQHVLTGPSLAEVLRAAGITGSGGKLAMRAIDGYSPTIAVADALKYGFILATHIDGEPMALGGLGPLWAVYEPDRFPEQAAKPLPDRFALCPWGLFHIEVQAG